MSKQLLGISILIGAVFAFSIYFLFIQLPNVLSKVRLGEAGGLWILFTLLVYGILYKDALKITRLSPSLIIGPILISLLFGLTTLSLIIDIESLPYNLLLLPKHKVQILIECGPSETQRTELKYFHNGISVVSYSSLVQQGDWERTNDSLRTTGCENTSLSYHGWLVEQPELVFKTTPDSGHVQVFWDDEITHASLYSTIPGEIHVTSDFGVDTTNKYTVFLTYLFALTILIYPVIQHVIRISAARNQNFDLHLWFEETGIRLQKISLSALILSLVLSITLFITPLFTADRSNSFSMPSGDIVEHPNVILIIVDALTAEDMSLYGYHLPTTPNLDMLTQDWTIFTNANTASTCSIGAYPSIITGRYPYYSYPFSHYGEQISTSSEWVNLIEILSKHDYQTWFWGYVTPGLYHTGHGVSHSIFFPWNNSLYKSWFQYDGVRNDELPYIPISIQALGTLNKYYEDFDSPQVLLDLISNHKLEEPFFFYLHYSGVHGMPYYAGEFLGKLLPIEEGMVGFDEQSKVSGGYLPEQQPLVDKLRLRYNESILYQDKNLGELIQALENFDFYDRSMIIITADHGQSFNNGFSTHCTPLISYAETHVPLLIKYPSQNQGQKSDALVSTIDITPTILDAASIPYEQNWFDGISLLNLSNQQHDHIFARSQFLEISSDDFGYAVIGQQHKLVRLKNDYRFHNYILDPEEQKYLTESNDISEQALSELRGYLEEFIQKASKGS